MVPAKALVVPSVAELPTCQNTLQACAPFSSTTELPDAVVSVEPAWKMNTAFGSPPPFRVTEPVRARLDVDWYTPETSVDPPRSPDTVVKGVRPAASRYAVDRSVWAARAAASVWWITPELKIPGGKPVMEVPGDRPTSPAITDEPVLVMVEAASTA